MLPTACNDVDLNADGSYEGQLKEHFFAGWDDEQEYFGTRERLATVDLATIDDHMEISIAGCTMRMEIHFNNGEELNAGTVHMTEKQSCVVDGGGAEVIYEWDAPSGLIVEMRQDGALEIEMFANGTGELLPGETKPRELWLRFDTHPDE